MLKRFYSFIIMRLVLTFKSSFMNGPNSFLKLPKNPKIIQSIKISRVENWKNRFLPLYYYFIIWRAPLISHDGKRKCFEFSWLTSPLILRTRYYTPCKLHGVRKRSVNFKIVCVPKWPPIFLMHNSPHSVHLNTFQQFFV